MNIEPRGYVDLEFRKNVSKEGILMISGHGLGTSPKPKSTSHSNTPYDISVLCFNPSDVIKELKRYPEFDGTQHLQCYDYECINKIRDIFIKKTNEYIFKPILYIDTLSEFLKVSKFEDISRQGYVKFKNSPIWQKKEIDTVIKNKAYRYTYVMANNKMQYVNPDSDLATSFPTQYLYRINLEFDFDKILKNIFTGHYTYKNFIQRRLKKSEHILYMSINGQPAGYQLLDLEQGKLIDPGYETFSKDKIQTPKSITNIVSTNNKAIDELMHIIFREPDAFKKFCYNLFIKPNDERNIFTDNSFMYSQCGNNISGIAVAIVTELIEYLDLEPINIYEFQLFDTSKNVILIDRNRNDIYNTDIDETETTGFQRITLEKWKVQYSAQFKYDDNFLKTSFCKSNAFLFYFLIWLST